MGNFDNTPYMEQLYADWQRGDPSVDPSWAAYFGSTQTEEQASAAAPAAPQGHSYKQSRVDSLIWAYRELGYRRASLNPLGGDYAGEHSYLPVPGDDSDFATLDVAEFGLGGEDMETEFLAGQAMRPSRAKLRDLVAAFRQTYCAHIGVEFLHIRNQRIRRWLIDRMESGRNMVPLQNSMKRAFLADLIRVEEFERFLGTHYVGQKRFSLEGSEAIVPALHYLVDRGAYANEIDTIVVGSTHRGRLSILHTVLGMSAEEIFSEFEENYGPGVYHGSGDVKYHLGYEAEHVNDDGSRVLVVVEANSSHLESVDCIVEGRTKGIQEGKGDRDGTRVVPVLLHGDGAFAGQGVVAETLNLSHLKGYYTGGTIHIVINNQIGFTTPGRYGRSSILPTDTAKALPIPVFHVNGDDPEAIISVMSLALAFRQTFHHDVIVDIFCFRRRGHNEGDEPSFTHPQMYRLIGKHPGVATLYGKKCHHDGVMSTAEQETLRGDMRAKLRASLDRARTSPVANISRSQGSGWDSLQRQFSFDDVATTVERTTLDTIIAATTTAPDGFNLHPKLSKILEGRRRRFESDATVDWATAESLAFGSLLLENVKVRMSGQDCTRGTFSQRHSIWWDTESTIPKPYLPLAHLSPAQAPVGLFDSPLSEYSVLAFEYGHSLVSPSTLTVWEAQFGDFSNGAQVIIDNYLAAAESRWQRRSGLVLLLPHGFEGQGPDHSTGHLERFLQLCAGENMQVCFPTTPAQYFHLLRRQCRAPYRKPLIIMSPKSLLRNRRAESAVADLTSGAFSFVIDDPAPPPDPRRLLLCSGKMYYDLVARRETVGDRTTAVIRMEQLYPFPGDHLERILKRYTTVQEIFWAQEEGENRGAWSFVRNRFDGAVPGGPLRYLGRPESGSSATGSFKRHLAEQEELLARAIPGTVSTEAASPAQHTVNTE
jgi:2-oxoglutarate dehydrogenase E1 component